MLSTEAFEYEIPALCQFLQEEVAAGGELHDIGAFVLIFETGENRSSFTGSPSRARMAAMRPVPTGATLLQ